MLYYVADFWLEQTNILVNAIFKIMRKKCTEIVLFFWIVVLLPPGGNLIAVKYIIS
jgi:hypothetical protein